MRGIRSILFVLTALLAGTDMLGQFYLGSNVEFGKNRVQYREFEWFYYPGPNFDVYYYIGGEKFAEYVLQSCESNAREIQAFFNYGLEDRIQVLAYLKQSEFRQSNIGISNDDQYNIGGAARIMGNKMFVFYEGDHARLEQQIRENISRVIFAQMMYGGDWKDVLKSSTLLSMPKWYEEGMVRFAAGSSPGEAETFMKDLVTAGRIPSLNRLYGREAALGGQAFWNYISQVYGESVIPNILYMARISRNIESGFLFVLGLSMDTITRDFNQYYSRKYGAIREEILPGETPRPSDPEALKAWKKEQRQMGDVEVRYRKKYSYSQFSVSPNGEYIAYVTNELGQYKLWVYDTKNKKSRRILKKEYRLDRIVDESFPVLAWHPSSEVLTYIYEEKGRAYIGNYQVDEKDHTIKELFRIEKVLSMDYSDDGKKIIFSGVNRGSTDLYLYQVIGNNQQQLTFDIYDDVDASFIDGGTRIIFASNRPDDTLRSDVPVDVYPHDKDIFILDTEKKDLLERITTTPGVDESKPFGYSALRYSYLSESDGIKNRYLAYIDSAISHIDTIIHYRYFTVSEPLSRFSRSPEDYRFDTKGGNYSLVFERRSRPVVFIGNRSEDQVLSYTGSSQTPPGDKEQKAGVQDDWLEIPDERSDAEVDIRNYVFEDELKDYSYEKESVRIQEVGEEAAIKDSLANQPFTLPKSRNYRLNFATDYILTQVDNSFTSAFYQAYTSPSSVNPGISGLVKIGISDLFEDYKVVGGFRLAGDLQNNDYGISFENLRSRWDRKLILQRQSQFQADQFEFFRVHTNSLTYQWKFPFTELASVRVSGMLRQDRKVQLAVDPRSLASPNEYTYNAGLRVEYVFDNTIARGLNLYNGTRFKFWVERYQEPDKIEEKTDFNVAGFDFRHYRRIHRELIAAFRVAGATTFGEYKLIHYLGGVDNWLFQRIDNSVPVQNPSDYRFQTFAGPLRGFYVNSRFGNSFLVSNSEIRWPVFKYFLRKPIKSDFVENFQVIGFFDAGTAWTGKSPYSEENEFNNTVVSQNPVVVTVDNNREPVIYGYGFGIRSRVLGYFMRADWAWGVDDGVVLPRVFYLSLNLDF